MIKAAIAVMFAVPLALLTVSVSVASVFGKGFPEIAHTWAPWDARVQAELARSQLQANVSDGSTRIAALARDALERDVTLVVAWRTLALLHASEGREEQAAHLMAISNRLSRRDLPTQLWLIENAASRGEVDQALLHYDYALRTERSAAQILLPVLATATRQRELVRPIAELVADDPPWAPGFFDYFARLAPSGANAAQLMTIVRQRGYSEPIPNASGLPMRLVQEQEYAAARKVYDLLLAGESGISRPNDPFGKMPKIAPFDWELISEANLRAEPVVRRGPKDPSSLLVFASDGEKGTVARRLFTYRPGKYVLTHAYELNSETPRPEGAWKLSCAGSGRQLIEASIDFSAPAKVSAPVVIPSGCEAQWLELIVRGPDGYDPAQFWIDQISLRGARPRSI